MKKHYAILCAVVLALSTLIGCGKASDSPAANGENNASSPKSDNNNTSEVVRIKYVVPGTEPKDYQKVFEKVNEKLAADGVGVEVEKIFIPWDAGPHSVL
jgi:putative aldouronate transport system substrate-binding protein